jgi:hypothetical protein
MSWRRGTPALAAADRDRELPAREGANAPAAIYDFSLARVRTTSHLKWMNRWSASSKIRS